MTSIDVLVERGDEGLEAALHVAAHSGSLPTARILEVYTSVILSARLIQSHRDSTIDTYQICTRSHSTADPSSISFYQKATAARLLTPPPRYLPARLRHSDHRHWARTTS